MFTHTHTHTQLNRNSFNKTNREISLLQSKLGGGRERETYGVEVEVMTGDVENRQKCHDPGNLLVIGDGLVYGKAIAYWGTPQVGQHVPHHRDEQYAKIKLNR